MAFRKNPIIEELPECIVCSAPVPVEVFVCSATCSDVQAYRLDSSPAFEYDENDCYA